MSVFKTVRRLNQRKGVDASRRRDLKRLAVFACAVVFGASVFSGCQTTQNAKKESKTVDDFLEADKPKW